MGTGREACAVVFAPLVCGIKGTSASRITGKLIDPRQKGSDQTIGTRPVQDPDILEIACHLSLLQIPGAEPNRRPSRMMIDCHLAFAFRFVLFATGTVDQRRLIVDETNVLPC